MNKLCGLQGKLSSLRRFHMNNLERLFYIYEEYP